MAVERQTKQRQTINRQAIQQSRLSLIVAGMPGANQRNQKQKMKIIQLINAELRKFIFVNECLYRRCFPCDDTTWAHPKYDHRIVILQ